MTRHRWTPYHEVDGSRCANCGVTRWFIDKPRSVRYRWPDGTEKALRESEPTPACRREEPKP